MILPIEAPKAFRNDLNEGLDKVGARPEDVVKPASYAKKLGYRSGDLEINLLAEGSPIYEVLWYSAYGYTLHGELFRLCEKHGFYFELDGGWINFYKGPC